MINFCARVVSGRRRHDHISDVLKELGWMSAKQLVEYHTVCAVRSVMITEHPECILGTIGAPVRQQHSHNTRHSDRHTVPRIRTEAGRRRLCYRGVSMMNRSRVHVNAPGYRAQLKRDIVGRTKSQ